MYPGRRSRMGGIRCYRTQEIARYEVRVKWMIVPLLLAVLASCALAKDSYVVIVPNDVRPGVQLNVSVNILKATGPVDVKADLLHKTTQNKVATNTKTFNQGSPGVLIVQVPDTLASGTYELLVLGTNGLHFTNQTDLKYQSKSMSVFIQTDKATYKPGQTVNFRAFAIHPDMSIYTGPIDIDVYDPNTNKIKQYKGLQDASGVVTNFLEMDTKPVLGDWKIKVTAQGRASEKVFTVAHYVLPKFEVTVNLPSYGLTSDNTLSGSVKATYTYGKPVQGKVHLRVRMERWYRPYNYKGAEPMVEQSLSIDGDVKFSLPLDVIKNANHYMNGRDLIVEANVTESLTNITLNGSSQLTYHNDAEKIEFLKSNPNTFKPGLTYTAYVKISQQDDTPITGAKTQLSMATSVTYELPEPSTTPLYYFGPRTKNYNLPAQTFTVPDTGVVPVQITIPDNATNINLHATYGKISAYRSLQKSYSPSNSYVQLFVKSSRLRAGTAASFDVKSTQPVSELTYQILSRGSIVKAGKVDGSNSKTFSFTIPVNAKMAPNARIVIYYVRADGEIVTDSISFDVDGVFQNQVSIGFDKTKAQPGDHVNVQVTADPHSLVSLLAVDQSVLLLKSGNDITPEEVISELKSYDTIQDQSSFYGGGGIMPFGRKKRMIFWPYPVYYGGSDAQQIFQNVGVKVMTDAVVYHHKVRHPYYPLPVAGGGFGAGGGGGMFLNGAMAGGAVPNSAFSGSVAGGSAPLQTVQRIHLLPPEEVLEEEAEEKYSRRWQEVLYQIVLLVAERVVLHHFRQFKGSGMSFLRHGFGLIQQRDYEHLAFGAGVEKVDAAMVPPMAPNMAPMPAKPPSNSLKSVDRIRNVFPETWLWTNKTVGSNGQVSISTTVPDTITSWIASAFAVNKNSGLGIADSTAKIEAFRPFFVSLNLPYSVVRGEQVALQANVFNYMSQDMDVLVTLEKNDDFRSIVMQGGQETFVSSVQTKTVKVAAGKAKSVFFPIVPAALGNIDITVKAQSSMAADGVRRQLLVEPEGVPKEYNVPILIDLKQTSTFTTTVPLTLPPGVVAGSENVRITAIGDLMGPTVNGLDKLLIMPYGCGEQTMLGFAPDVFVTNYLTATHQLSPDIEDKAVGFMEKGYQRELTFQHKDGSFSAFGDNDKSGSMWLTAFVAKSFHQAKQHIFIDDETLTRAIDWMIARQSKDGSFPEPGRVIHKDMQGGSASGPGLTAFVLISLLENNDLQGGVQQRIQSAVSKAVSYLNHNIMTQTDDYVLAIASYALELAHSQSADRVFAKLNADAIVKNGMKHWHKNQPKPSTNRHHWQSPQRQADPVDIEMTSYALLVYGDKKEFTEGLPVMKWITSQRNPHGGFSSTQDTVVALQALSEFAKMAYADNFDINADVTLDSSKNIDHTFNINAKNALVLQSYVPNYTPLQVKVSATGHGMGLVQVSVFFNVEQEIQEPTFDLTVQILEETMNSIKVQTCTHWLLPDTSGMAVQELGVPTGFEADLESISKLDTLKKIETEDRKVVLYFDEISSAPSCVTMVAMRTGLVAKSKPAAVRVYDYYAPSNQVTAFYESHTLKSSSICDVCDECGCPAKVTISSLYKALLNIIMKSPRK
ncbi:hypothetical protein FSP39_014251 [Pinctada imbricata]|uniref:CD109 antigen n=1 Tax=Pinctada imbricata TaxID=66713 RepID=A0AA89BXE3_PINIB|nr:hypothetical protein FSP39_014251 [Pinctada imbricata]